MQRIILSILTILTAACSTANAATSCEVARAMRTNGREQNTLTTHYTHAIHDAARHGDPATMRRVLAERASTLARVRAGEADRLATARLADSVSGCR